MPGRAGADAGPVGLASLAAVRRRFLTLVGLLALAVAASGCGNDGRDLAAPQSWQTTTTRPPPPTSAPDSEVSPSGLSLSSPDFAPGDPAPIDATCAGSNKFPRLVWSDVPDGTAEIAVTLSDQTDPEEPLLLWLMAGIDPSLGGLEPGTAPAGAFETLNDYGNLGYGSPCLENLADGTRDLQFRLYILDQPSGLVPGDPGNESWNELGARSIDSATLLMRIDASTT